MSSQPEIAPDYTPETLPNGFEHLGELVLDVEASSAQGRALLVSHLREEFDVGVEYEDAQTRALVITKGSGSP